jgi:dihydroceramidase
MAPVEKDFEGFWGKPTATIDWCEANYEVTYYIAEFWNTISNFFLIVPPLCAAIIAKRDGQEDRFFYCHIGLMIVGIGSWCFHGTLLYQMQLLDELPMIWGSAFLIYALIEVDGSKNQHNVKLSLSLFIYCLIVTVVYLTINEPVFHECAYALMVLTMVFYSLRIIRNYAHSLHLFILSIALYGTGFIIWNLDNIFCDKIRSARSEVGYPLKPLLQGHSWWHVLTGTGTYFGLLFGIHARGKFIKDEVCIKRVGGVWPLALRWKNLKKNTAD